MKKIGILLILLGFIFGLNTSLIAQEEDITDLVQLKADHMAYEENKIVVEQNVKITRNNYDLNSPYAEIYRDEKRAVLKEGVNVIYDQGDIKSQTMNAYFEENRFVFEKDIILNHELDNGNKFKLESLYLEMFSEDNSFQAEEEVEIIYNDDRELRSEVAEYKGEEEKLILTENVRIEEDDGWIECNTAEFDLGEETETFVADGEVELEFEL
ncbi:MAG: LPS export ABC transporter periplasmic protein LptC [Bacillota bacterium]